MSYLATARRALAARIQEGEEPRKESERSEESGGRGGFTSLSSLNAPGGTRPTRTEGGPALILDPVEPEHRVYDFRVVVDSIEPIPCPVELRPGVRAVDFPRAIEALVADLAVAVTRYGETCADGGDDRRFRAATEAGERIEGLIGDLEKLGARVRVVGVQ